MILFFNFLIWPCPWCNFNWLFLVLVSCCCAMVNSWQLLIWTKMLVREKIKITLTAALYLDIWVVSKCINMIQIYISSISKIAQRVTNTNKVYWMQTIILIDILCIGCQYRYRFLITFHQLFINSVNQLGTLPGPPWSLATGIPPIQPSQGNSIPSHWKWRSC